MAPRVAKRGKGPRDQSQVEEPEVEPPSQLLSEMLGTLSLSFERDIGMLNGKHVRSVPARSALVELRAQLEKLLVSLGNIAESDRHTIETLRKIKESRVAGPEQQSVPNGKTIPGESKEQDLGELSDDGREPITVKRRKRSLNIDNDDEEADESEREKPTDNIPVSPTKKIKLDEQNEPDVDVSQMENDPSVKNPKSEFVVSQTLPAAAAALGLFSDTGLESTGEDSLRKKYDVASYPTNDLKELLPGELPDMDFSHPKPTNQIQYGTFLSFVENFFRALNDDDIKFLKSKYIIPAGLKVDKLYDPEVTPYIIPKLGPLYSDVWDKEDNISGLAGTSPPPVNDPTAVLPRRSAADIADATLDTEEISCGPLVSRLLSAILKEDGENVRIKQEGDSLESREDTPDPTAVNTPASEVDNISRPAPNGTTSTLPNPQMWKINSINLDYPTFEERLKRELKFVGIYVNMPKDENNATGDDPDWLTGREDDEVSAELRELQNSLKQVTVKNQKRKTALVPLLERKLAWQEYSSILDDLDKQIDQAYVKRIRVPKKRKKQQSAASTTVNTENASQAAQQKAANSSLKALLDKRQRWISKIGPLFDKPEIMKRIPKESVFRDLDQEEEEEETDLFSQNGNSKDDELAEA